MTLVTCIEKENGMFFNDRRLSIDRYLIDDIIKTIQGNCLLIMDYSYELFKDKYKNIKIINELPNELEKNDFIFLENIDINQVINKFDKIILYNWNTNYPSDKKLKINSDIWKLNNKTDILGYSHKKIIKEIYFKENNNEK